MLASSSPQRKAILEQLGVAFEIRVPDVDEVAGGDPESLVYENARLKARAGAVGGAQRVLGVDTAVVIDGEMLGKPTGPEQARTFLERLSGRTHAVLSGLCLLEGETERGGVAVTHVTFRTLSTRIIDRYLETGEWSARAGAYAIQGHGAVLVERIDGDYWNVVGLPVSLLLDLAPDLMEVGT